MTTFLKGPAEGHILMLKRAPRFLRVVIDTSRKVDALDQIDDHAAANEEVHVYEISAKRGPVHVKSGIKGASGWYQFAEYRYVEPPPADAQVRDNAAWRRWCYAAAESRPLLIPQP